MSDLAQLDAVTDAAEGFRPCAYRDPKGFWTIGLGRCLVKNPLTAAEWGYLLDQGMLTLNITHDGAAWLRDQEYARASDYMHAHYVWFATLDQPRQDALLEMLFQLGAVHFSAFHKMLSAATIGNWAETYHEALDSDWARDRTTPPARAQRIARQLLTGEFQSPT